MLHTTDDATFDLMLNVHVSAPFRLIREVAPYMRKKDGSKSKANRSIINVSSTSGLHGNVGQAKCVIPFLFFLLLLVVVLVVGR